MECGDVDACNNEVENVASLFPPTRLSVPLPSGVVPSRKVTSPVGVPETAVTVAVNVTVSPRVIVPCDGETVVVVADETGGEGRAFLAARWLAFAGEMLRISVARVGPGIAPDEQAPNEAR